MAPREVLRTNLTLLRASLNLKCIWRAFINSSCTWDSGCFWSNPDCSPITELMLSIYESQRKHSQTNCHHNISLLPASWYKKSDQLTEESYLCVFKWCALLCKCLKWGYAFTRNGIDPATQRRRVGTEATAPTQPTCCPAGWRKNRGCSRFPAPSSSSTFSTCRAWASFWSRSDLSLQPAGLYLQERLESMWNHPCCALNLDGSRQSRRC